MRYSSLIFDLDGTLLDTIDDIGTAANTVLEELGYPSHPLPAYQKFVGSGVAVLFQRAIQGGKPRQSEVEDCVARFQRVYASCWNQASKPYNEILELLKKLSISQCKLAILSNKPDVFTKKCVSYYFSSYHFEPVFGQRSNVTRKPDPQAVWEIMQQHQSSAEQTMFVGDSEIDVQTAQNAGVFSVGVGWGYRGSEVLLAQGVDLIVEHPSDLLDFLDGQI